MIMIETLPDDLLQDLNEMSDWFFSQDRTSFQVEGLSLKSDECTSIEYLKKQQERNLAGYGYPENAQGLDFKECKGYDLDIFQKKITDYDGRFRSFLGAKYCALRMYYPAGGFIDWHTNANAYGYNVLLTYSTTGDGAFMYQHPLTKEIVVLHDKPGWTMKVGMYDKEGGVPLWHAAYTNCERLNWGYVLPDNGWENLVEELNIDVAELESIYGELPKLKFNHDTTY